MGHRCILLPAIFLVLFAQSVAQTKDLNFPDGGKTLLPFKIADNLVLIDVRVNGNLGTFIFDTGAESTVVNTSFAKKIGLKAKGNTVGTGSAGSATAGIIRGVRVEAGGVVAEDLTVYSLSIDAFGPALGYRIDGILGNDLIAQTVAEIDYRQQVLTLYRSSAFELPKDATVLPLIIIDNLPFVMASVGVSPTRSLVGRMEIDTGSTGALLLNSPFVRRNSLTSALGNAVATRTGGVGGTGTSLIGRYSAIKLGNVSLTDPLIQLYTGSRGDNASALYDGLLGGAVFRRFRMTVDMPGRRLFLEPNDRLNETFETDMSGLDLVADGDEFDVITIDEVKTPSVAAKAGIRGGEVIRSLNGRLASAIGLQEVRRILRTAGEVELELVRGTRTVKVRLILGRVV